MFETLTQLQENLQAKGHAAAAAAIAAIRADADLIDRPPRFFHRLATGVHDAAAANWERILKELAESRDLCALLDAHVRTGKALTPEQADAVRAQLLDIFKIVPGGVIAVSNALLPIPGTSALTPVLLSRLGLLPSSWREASVLERLRRERDALLRDGHSADAREVGHILATAEGDGVRRQQLEALQRNPDLFGFYDRDRNGLLDADERHTYEAACAAVIAAAHRHGPRRIWYVCDHEEVRGPYRLVDIPRAELSPEAWVCVEEQREWVPLAPILVAADAT